MPGSVFNSEIYGDLFGDDEVSALFDDRAEISAMLAVEAALAGAQAAQGMIPKASAIAIKKATEIIELDPAKLRAETGHNAVPVPALVAAFRAAMDAPDHAQYLHWGATSQDIMDSALMLRLTKVLDTFEVRLRTLAAALGVLAGEHAALPMAARTYGQVATPTSFGAVVADWGRPILTHLDRLQELRPRLLCVSLSGAGGTASVFGGKAAAVRGEMAARLGLNDPGHSWHSARDRLAELAALLTLIATSIGKMGEDLILLTQSGIEEVTLGTTGSSSTMPQKSNPVLPSLMAALSRQAVGLNTALQCAPLHKQQRDGAAWISEWMTLPQMMLTVGRALTAATEVAATMRPNADRMARNLHEPLGLIYAEALTFALAGSLSRPDAQAAVKELCVRARAENRPLPDLAAEAWPERIDMAFFDPAAHLGEAPVQARAFEKGVSALAT